MLGLGQVSHLWFGFGKISPKIPKFSNFFPSVQNKSLRVWPKSIRIKDG